MRYAYVSPTPCCPLTLFVCASSEKNPPYYVHCSKIRKELKVVQGHGFFLHYKFSKMLILAFEILIVQPLVVIDAHLLYSTIFPYL